MKRAGYSATDLSNLSAAVEQILLAGGIPLGSVSNFSTVPAVCKIHSESISTDLHLSGAGDVRIVHCGCDSWLTPVAPPPGDMVEMTHDLAEEILWYWNWQANAVAMMATLRVAFEQSAAKVGFQPRDCKLVAVSLMNFDTFRGRNSMAHFAFDLLWNNLGLQRWSRDFQTPSDVVKFFRGMRPYQLALAERRDELEKVGACGAIDMVAVAALRRARINPLEIIARYLLGERSTWIDLGDGQLLLAWRMGTIRGELDLAPGVKWKFGEIIFAKGYIFPPRSGGTNKAPIGEFLTSPLLPEQAPVRCSSGSLDGSRTHCIDPEVKLFGFVDGKLTWIEAAL